MSSLRILQIHSSGRRADSSTRRLSEQFVSKLRNEGARVVVRDLADGMPFVDERWIGANFTPSENRTAEQSATLSYSDSLVQELKDADLIVIGAPIYNFSVPAALKAWIDQIMRARVTFQYGANGPEGLLKGRRAVIVTASGGTTSGSQADFATSYLKFVLGFMGVEVVGVIAEDGQTIDAAGARVRAENSSNAALAAFSPDLADAA